MDKIALLWSNHPWLLVESTVTGRRASDVTTSLNPAPEILRTNIQFSGLSNVLFRRIEHTEPTSRAHRRFN